jgi:basic membrane protein A and related proteins
MKRCGLIFVSLLFTFAIVSFGFAGGAKEEGKAKTGKISVGIIMWGYHDEGVWDTNAYESVVALSKKYPIEVRYSEGIDMKTIEATVKARAEMDDIVWAHSKGYEDAVRKVAPSYPKTVFLVEYAENRGKDYYPPNVITIGQGPQEALFLVGALSAKMSKSKKLGIVQAITSPADNLYSAAYRDGAQYVDPSIKVSRFIVEAYLDPVKTRDAVKAFVEQGADVVFVSMDDTSGSMEAKAQGIYSVQHYKDVTAQFPDTILSNALWKFDGAVEMIVKALQDGTFKDFRATHWFIPLTLKDGTCGIGTYGNMVTADIKAYIDDLATKIKAGDLKVTQKFDW